MEHITEHCLQEQILAHAYWTYGLKHWEKFKDSVVPLNKTRRKTLTMIDILGELSVDHMARRYSCPGYDEAHQTKYFNYWFDVRYHHTYTTAPLWPWIETFQERTEKRILAKLVSKSVFSQPCLRPSKVRTALFYTRTDTLFKNKVKISVYGRTHQKERIGPLPYASIQSILYPARFEEDLLDVV